MLRVAVTTVKLALHGVVPLNLNVYLFLSVNMISPPE